MRVASASSASAPSGEYQQAAILMLWADTHTEDPRVLFIKRAEKLDRHPGQYAFPGGCTEPVDKNPAETALREAYEEVGLAPQAVEVLGSLSPLYTPTGFVITPVVGITRAAEELRLVLDAVEVDEAFWVRYSELNAPGVYKTEDYRGFSVHAYYVGERRIWGATASILHEWQSRLNLVRV